MLLNKDKIMGERIKIEFTYLGEGFEGNYNPEDPNDQKLIRFTVWTRVKPGAPWKMADDCSYCTRIPYEAPATDRRSLLLLMYKEFLFALEEKRPLSQVAQIMSWASPFWLEEDTQKTRAIIREDVND